MKYTKIALLSFGLLWLTGCGRTEIQTGHEINTVSPLTDLNLQQCETDQDCKLIYSACGCQAVLLGDPRLMWENDTATQCTGNECAGGQVQAICQNNQCQKNS
jgi:hypothetical protein